MGNVAFHERVQGELEGLDHSYEKVSLVAARQDLSSRSTVILIAMPDPCHIHSHRAQEPELL
jgi:hypothetical protein